MGGGVGETVGESWGGAVASSAIPVDSVPGLESNVGGTRAASDVGKLELELQAGISKANRIRYPKWHIFNMITSKSDNPK